LTGGLVASVLAEVLSRGFASYVSHGSVLTVYGASRLAPIFLLWIYFSWFTVLFGAAIAATVSGLRETRYSDETRAGNRFVTAVGLLKLLLQARANRRVATNRRSSWPCESAATRRKLSSFWNKWNGSDMSADRITAFSTLHALAVGL